MTQRSNGSKSSSASPSTSAERTIDETTPSWNCLGRSSSESQDLSRNEASFAFLALWIAHRQGVTRAVGLEIRSQRNHTTHLNTKEATAWQKKEQGRPRRELDGTQCLVVIG
jgi:hypothetical protein